MGGNEELGWNHFLAVVWHLLSCRHASLVACLANTGRNHSMLADLNDEKSVYRTVIPINKWLYYTTHSDCTSDLTEEGQQTACYSEKELLCICIILVVYIAIICFVQSTKFEKQIILQSQIHILF